MRRRHLLRRLGPGGNGPGRHLLPEPSHGPAGEHPRLVRGGGTRPSGGVVQPRPQRAPAVGHRRHPLRRPEVGVRGHAARRSQGAGGESVASRARGLDAVPGLQPSDRGAVRRGGRRPDPRVPAHAAAQERRGARLVTGGGAAHRRGHDGDDRWHAAGHARVRARVPPRRRLPRRRRRGLPALHQLDPAGCAGPLLSRPDAVEPDPPAGRRRLDRAEHRLPGLRRARRCAR